MNDQVPGKPFKVVVFKLDGLLYALPLENVIRVIHAVAYRELPESPKIIAGIINVKGQIIPVVNMRLRFGLQDQEIIPDDNFILAQTGKRDVALWINEVTEIREIATEKYLVTNEALPFPDFIKGVARIEGSVILIYDLEQCLNLKEEMELERALSLNGI